MVMKMKQKPEALEGHQSALHEDKEGTVYENETTTNPTGEIPSIGGQGSCVYVPVFQKLAKYMMFLMVSHQVRLNIK